jgi:putative tryptophan/tyrosine transport system substrate-binding protein
MMHGRRKSDSAIVAVKPANNAERSAAEPVEPRAEAKGNVGQLSTRRTQSRISVSKMLARIRQMVAVDTRGGSRMRESCTYGSERGARGNSRPYRDRRAFITLLGGAVVAWPLAARAQESRIPVIGFIRNTTRDDSADLLKAMHQGLAQTGYVEGRNVAVEYRFADNQLDRLPTMAADLVRRQVAVIVAGGDASSFAAKAATTTIPIIFSIGFDPIEIGLVTSLSRPGGNVTGVSFFSTLGTAAKRLDLLDQLMPKDAIIAYLRNPNSPTGEPELGEVENAAHSLARQILILSVGSERELEPTLASLAQHRSVALLVSGHSLFTSLRKRLVVLTARQALPTMHYLREFTATGGLMSYGASVTDAYRQAGIYAGRILKGEKPGDLPVMLPTKFELVINVKTAKALGLEIPDKLLALADEVIE